MFVVSYIVFYTFFLGAVCRTLEAIGSYEGPSKKSESVEARYPDNLLSDLRSAGGHKHSGVEAPAPQFVKVACYTHP